MADRIQDEVRDYLETALASPTTSLKKFYSGFVEPSKIPVNDMPVLMVYETEEQLLSDQLTTARDKYRFGLTIQVVINAFQYVSGAGIEADKILLAQRAVQDILSARDANRVPLSTSVLGILRQNILGANYLFQNDARIEFKNKNEDGKIFIIGTLTVSVITAYNNRV